MVAQMSIYTVEARRDGRWWVLSVPDVPGAVSQVRSLSQADEYIRESIAFVREVEPDSFELRIQPILPEEAATVVAGAKAAIADLDRRQRDTAILSRVAARNLIAHGLTGADAAIVLKVSPQRVSQLVHESQDVPDEVVQDLVREYA
jgi:predicted RNase H-like HicB family nuclease